MLLRRPDPALTSGVWERIAAAKDASLQTAAAMVRDNLRDDLSTYVSVNNHYEGCAPLTIQRLLDILAQS